MARHAHGDRRQHRVDQFAIGVGATPGSVDDVEQPAARR